MTNQEALITIYRAARNAPLNADIHDAVKIAAEQLEKFIESNEIQEQDKTRSRKDT